MVLSTKTSCLLLVLALCAPFKTLQHRALESYTASVGGYSATESTIDINTPTKFTSSNTASVGYIYHLPSTSSVALTLKVTVSGAPLTACWATDATDTSYDTSASYSYTGDTSSTSTSASYSSGSSSSTDSTDSMCLSVDAGSSKSATISAAELKGGHYLAISIGITGDGDGTATGTIELLGPGLSAKQKALVIGLVVGVGGLLIIGAIVALIIRSNRRRRAQRNNVAKVQGQPQFGQPQFGQPQPQYGQPQPIQPNPQYGQPQPQYR